MASTRYAEMPTMRATAANGICGASISTSASNSSVKPESLPANGGLTRAHRPVGQLDARRAHFEHALVLEEVQVPIGLGHRVVHRVISRGAIHGKAAAGGEVDTHRQHLAFAAPVFARH